MAKVGHDKQPINYQTLTNSSSHHETCQNNTNQQDIAEIQLSTELLDVTESGNVTVVRTRVRTLSTRLAENMINVGLASTVPTIEEVEIQTRKSSSLIICWNITNLICGVGILGVPYAVLLAGWSSIFLISMAGFLTYSSSIWLIDCLYQEYPFGSSRVRLLCSYAEIAQKVWPALGHVVIYTTMLIELFSVLSLLILVLSQTSWQVIDFYCDLNIDQRLWYMIAAYATLPIILFIHMSLITSFGMLAVLGLMSAIVTLLAFCLIQYDRILLSNIIAPTPLTFPISIGIFMFSFCAHPAFPTIEGNMSTPESYKRVVGISFGLSTFLKITLGILSVLIWGSGTDEQITNNIPPTHTAHVLTSLFVSGNVFFTIPLIVFVLNEVIDSFLLPHFDPVFWDSGRCHWAWTAVIRIILLTSAMLVGMIVPHFSLLMGLVGSLTATSLSLIFPALFSLKLRWNSLSLVQIVFRIAVGLFGVCVAFVGTASALMKIISVLRTEALNVV